MTKFFLILIIIVTVSYLFISFILNKVKNFLSGYSQPAKPVNKKKNKDEILYDKDGIQVLKGIAGISKEDKEKQRNINE